MKYTCEAKLVERIVGGIKACHDCKGVKDYDGTFGVSNESPMPRYISKNISFSVSDLFTKQWLSCVFVH